MTFVQEVSIAVEDGVVRGRHSHAAGSTGPLLVGIHGIGYDARYFDAPGMSVHRRAAHAGLSMLSLTRPGYPATDVSAKTQPTFAESARTLSSAIGSFWSTMTEPSPGVVVLGHSVGGAVAIHLAAHVGTGGQATDWPLLGIAVSGIGDTPAASAVAQFGSIPRNLALTLPFALARAAFYGPADTLIPDTDSILEDLLVPFPSADAVEVNTTWGNDFAELAGHIRVPVDITLAELDPLWVVNSESIARMSACFARSSRVTHSIMPQIGHNIEHHREGSTYFARVLSFALECARQ